MLISLGRALHGMAGPGMAWRGRAGHCKAWRGMAWQGTGSLQAPRQSAGRSSTTSSFVPSARITVHCRRPSRDTPSTALTTSVQSLRPIERSGTGCSPAGCSPQMHRSCIKCPHFIGSNRPAIGRQASGGYPHTAWPSVASRRNSASGTRPLQIRHQPANRCAPHSQGARAPRTTAGRSPCRTYPPAQC
jgi:hypothetical protein